METGLSRIDRIRHYIAIAAENEVTGPSGGEILQVEAVLYRNKPDGRVAEIPAIPGRHAQMPTRQEALAELAEVFQLISDEYRQTDQPLPADTTEILHAWRSG